MCVHLEQSQLGLEHVPIEGVLQRLVGMVDQQSLEGVHLSRQTDSLKKIG